MARKAELSRTLIARIVNAIKSVPDGYKTHSDAPIIRCLEWARGQDSVNYEAAVIVIEGIAKSDPGMITGTGWISEADARMALITGEKKPSLSQPGMTPKQLAEKIEADTAAKVKENSDLARQQNENNDITGDAKKEKAVEDAFKPIDEGHPDENYVDMS